MASKSCPHLYHCVRALKEGQLEQLLTRQEKGQLSCHVCGRTPNNLWLCLFPQCWMLGCSDDEAGSPDCSTKHHDRNPTHVVQFNVRTKKIWCYACTREVTQDLINTPSATPTTFMPPGMAQATPVEEAERRMRDDDGGTPPGGIVGLSNLGNTCYMNAALQCLSNVPALTEFFLTCSAVVDKVAEDSHQQQKKSLSQAYLQHIKRVWGAPATGHHRHVAPQGLLTAFKHSHPMFRGFHQQDSQEFLKYFLDQLHEELMEPISCTEDAEDDEESTAEQGVESNGAEVGGSSRNSSASPGEDEEEYETADSGVSEQSSTSSSSDNLNNRKRKQGSGGDNAEVILEAGDHVGDDDVSTSGVSSGTAEQPPTNNAVKRHRSISLSQKNQVPKAPKICKRKPKIYKSVVSDIFDGKLISTVQCLTCHRVSTTTETFQDLSLPIPTLDSIQSATARNQRLASAASMTTTSSLSSSLNPGSMTSLNLAEAGSNPGWLGWMWGWVSSWFYGPNITLHDCLAYFFSADELKGENMYSCEKCKKLRNGLKYSRVTDLPDTLCIHLKRFRHDFSFSSKISSKVTFPLVDLDMSPWLHQDCISKETKYDLTGIVCHHGTSGGGHYTAYALNPVNEEWYEFDDSFVTKVEPSVVLNAEAYVLFYRKTSVRMDDVRTEIQELLRHQTNTPSLVQHYISRQWINKFENFAEPGPIDNSDFLCRHGGIQPTKVAHVQDLCAEFPRSVWEVLDSEFGTVQLGRTAPLACTRLYACMTCKAELEALNFQKSYELEEFKRLHHELQTGPTADVLFCLAMSWFKLWEAFVTGRARDPPGEIDNRGIVTQTRRAHGEASVVQILRSNSDHLRVSPAIWNLFKSIYGGGPEVILKANGVSVVIPTSSPPPPASGLSSPSRAGSPTDRPRTISESSSLKI